MAEWSPSILMFLLAGCLIAYCVRECRLALEARRLAHASLRWPTTPGRVVASSVQMEILGSDADGVAHYVPDVHFTYVVEGTTYTGTTVAFRDLRGWKKQAAALVARYPVGAEVAVHYNPDAPGECVLEAGTVGIRRRFVWIALGILVGVGLAAVGVIIPLFHLAP
jgi:hypothetical protein